MSTGISERTIIHALSHQSNVLVKDDGMAIIADFGLAVFLRGHSWNYASTRSGNVRWTALEVTKSEKRPTEQSDV